MADAQHEYHDPSLLDGVEHAIAADTNASGVVQPA